MKDCIHYKKGKCKCKKLDYEFCPYLEEKSCDEYKPIINLKKKKS